MIQEKDGNQHSEPIRCAIYARYSSEMQNELSIQDQVARCREEIARRGWRVAEVFTDSAKSGWSLDREGFQELRAAAEHKKFNAIMLWKFDRLARDHDHAVMIKALLRHQYDLKLFCVEGVSEDDDDTPYSAMIEQMLAVFAAFYSRNLSSDTKRAKRARAMRGEFNGSIPPIGYRLVTKGQTTSDCPAGLHIDPEVGPIIEQAFQLYATDEYSDRTLAEWMNKQSIIQRTREGEKPIGKAMVRDMLQNRVYTGRIPYAETIYNGATLGQRKKSSRKRKTWHRGRHEAIIDDDLFNACQSIRAGRRTTRRTSMQMRTYIFPDRVYCAHCFAESHVNLGDSNYGKMRLQWQKQKNAAIYRCIARDRGYGDCEQSIIYEEDVLNQIVAALSCLKIPENVNERIDEMVRSRPANQDTLDQIAELEEQLQRVQFSWEHGKLTPGEYIGKIERIESEIASRRPLDYDKIEEAKGLIAHFRTRWDQALETDCPEEARRDIFVKVIDRVFVYDDDVIAIALPTDFGVLFGTSEGSATPIKKTRKPLQTSVPTTGATGFGTEMGAMSGHLGSQSIMS